MKKIIILINLLLVTLVLIGQEDYPKYIIDSSGQRVVVMTVKQAQMLDNKTDLLVLFEKLNSEIGSYDTVCLRVVNQKDSVIVSQSFEINKLKEVSVSKDLIIDNLKGQISQCLTKIEFLNLKITNKDAEIVVHKKELKKSKRNRVISGVVGLFAGLLIGIFAK
jgi:hypothetical protein